MTALPPRFVARRHPYPTVETWYIYDTQVGQDESPAIFATCASEDRALAIAEALNEYYAQDPNRELSQRRLEPHFR